MHFLEECLLIAGVVLDPRLVVSALERAQGEIAGEDPPIMLLKTIPWTLMTTGMHLM